MTNASSIKCESVREEALTILSRLDVPESAFAHGGVPASSPITGEIIADVHVRDEAATAIGRAACAFSAWRTVPAPHRGEFVRTLAEELRASKDDLGRLVTLETGKIISEGLGEVQEMIDICDFAVGLSRQLYGRTIASERADHRIMETWHPLGVCGVISAFNFPVAVWAWNAALAFVRGDPVVWKPSEKAPLSALATQSLVKRAMRRFGQAPEGLFEVLIGGRDVGEALVDDGRKKWSKEKENAMRRSLLVPALALGVALSGSAFGHSWSAKMTGQPYSANSPSSKPASSAKMSAQLNSGKSSPSNAVNRVEMSGGPHGD